MIPKLPLSNFGTRVRRCVAVLALVWSGGVFSPALAQSVQLSWVPSPDTNVVSYVVHYGTQSGVYTNYFTFANVTTAILPGLQSGVTYYFAVAAVNSLGIASELSNEASCLIPYPTPIQLQAQSAYALKAVELNWTVSAGNGAYAYLLQYGTQSGVYTHSIIYFNTTDVVISGLDAGTTNYFSVSALNASGTPSLTSNQAQIFVAVPQPIVLQLQTSLDGNGQLLMEISANAVVNGPWELDSSTDLQHWTDFFNGYGYGYGNGYDVNVYLLVDPTQPQMFFRLINY